MQLLCVEALGKNPKDVGGVDLIEKLADRSIYEGSNSYITVRAPMVLFAFDAMDVEIPEGDAYITREEIVTSLEASNEVESIHQSAYQKDGSEISLLDKLSKGENESEKVVDHVLLKEAMKHLEQKEQQMIYYRYFEGKTQQEIAKIFHISQVQVSRIQKKILKKLRRQMIGNI